MEITRTDYFRLINLSLVGLLHQIECGCLYSRADGLKDDMAAVLDERQRQVLTLRWGLEDGRPQTLTAIGREFGVTGERIRQIEAKALRMLKAERNKRRPVGDVRR